MVNPATILLCLILKNWKHKTIPLRVISKIGEISDPYESVDENGKTLYKIIKVKSRTNPHRANLEQDYLLIQNMALGIKKQKLLKTG